MKPNDTIFIEGEGQAKLIRQLEIIGEFELWDVEFEDCPGKEWSRMIKK